MIIPLSLLTVLSMVTYLTLFITLFVRPITVRFVPYSILKYRVSAHVVETIVHAMRLIHRRLRKSNATATKTIDYALDMPAYTAVDIYKAGVDQYIEGKILPILIGRDTKNKLHFMDLATSPHMLVAGMTGYGKSVCFQNIIFWLSKASTKLEIHVIDPKQTQFYPFTFSEHPKVHVVFDQEKFAQKMGAIIGIMNDRNDLMRKAGYQEISEYNQDNPTKALSYIIFFIDEFQALDRKLQPLITQIVNMGRSAGIHLVLGTQNPHGNNIKNDILMQLGSVICFKVKEKSQSERIAGRAGAEKIAHKGNMLFRSADLDFYGKAPMCSLSDFDFYATYKNQSRGNPLEVSSQVSNPKKRGRPRKTIQKAK